MEQDRNANLVPRKQGIGKTNSTSSKASQEMLAVQLQLTVSNAKDLMEPELTEEFARLFSRWPSEAIKWAFETWRLQCEFTPKICQIQTLLNDWNRGQREQEELRRHLNEKFAVEEGRKQGLVPDFADVKKQLAEIANKVKMPDHLKRFQEFERKGRERRANIPTIAQHLTDEQRAARLEKEREEIRRYEERE